MTLLNRAISYTQSQSSGRVLMAAAMLTATASAVYAGEDQLLLEEVLVTAQKREQSIQDVPIAISAFGSKDLKRLNAADMSDLQYSTPNLTISTHNKTTPRIGIRGISDFSRNPGYDNRVSVYVDGMYAGRSAASNQSTLDIERVEVLRGPQGTLFGKNTVAGAISLTTRKPTEEFNASLKLEVGNYDYTSVTGMVSGPLVEDKLFAKLMVNDKQRDGYKTNILTGDDLDGLDEQSARLQLRWLLDDGEVNVYLDSSKDEAASTPTEAISDPFAPEIYDVSIDSDASQTVDTFGAGMSIDYTLPNNFELTSITGYRDTDLSFLNDEDYSPIDNAVLHMTEDSYHFSQEFRLASPKNDTYDYILGLYYFEQTNESRSSVITGPGFLISPFSAVSLSPAEVDVTSYAAFAHANYRLSDRWELTGGLRYTYEEKKLDYTINNSFFLFGNPLIPLFADGSLKDDRDAENLSPKLGVNFYLNQDVMFYAGYSKGFKSGGWNADFISSFETMAFDDEEVDSYELGMKSTLAEGRVRFNAALYSANYSDFQVFQFISLRPGVTLLALTNAGEVTAEGFEADVNWAVTQHVTLWATYGYTDSSFDEFKDGGGVGIHFDGNKTPDAPSETYSLGLEFRYPVGDIGELVASADYSYRDEFYTHPNNLEVNRVGAYDIVNARIGIESLDESWSLYAWGKNLNDANDLTDSSITFQGVMRGNYLRPRMYGVSFEYRLGS